MERVLMQQLGRYRILNEIGRGGFATVYRALDPGLDREVAVKVLHPVLLSDSTFHQRFRREARALAALRHQHILMVFEVAEADGRLFIVMELAHGPSLAKRIEDSGPVPWDEALEILKPVCEALDYAHRMDIVHRDLKPSNILLDHERGALLSDFGLARVMSASTTTTVTSPSGGILGTPSYIAPELWDFEVANAASDIYAMGCIIYEMLTGKLLFAGSTPVQVLRAHDRGPRFPEHWPDDVPEGIAEVLSKALDKEPKDRYATPMQLYRALEALAHPEREVRPAATVPRIEAPPAEPKPNGKEIAAEAPPPAQPTVRSELPAREPAPVEPPAPEPVAPAAAELTPAQTAVPTAAAPAPEMVPVTVAASAMPVSEPARSAKPAAGQGRFDLARLLMAIAMLGAAGAFYYVWRDYGWSEYGDRIQGFALAFAVLFVLLVLPTGRALRASGVFRFLGLLVTAGSLAFNLAVILPLKGDWNYQLPLMIAAGAQALAVLLFLVVPKAKRAAAVSVTPAASAAAASAAASSATATPPSTAKRAHGGLTPLHAWMLVLVLLFAFIWYSLGVFFNFYPIQTIVITIALLPALLFLYLLPPLRQSRRLFNGLFLASLPLLGAWLYYIFNNEILYVYDEIRLRLFTSLLAGWGLFLLLLVDRRTLASAERAEVPTRSGPRQMWMVLLGLALEYAWFHIGRYYGFTPLFVILPLLLLPALLIPAYLLLAGGKTKRTLRVVMMVYFLLSALAWTVVFLEDVSNMEPDKIVAVTIARLAELGLFILLLRDPSAHLEPAGAEVAGERASVASVAVAGRAHPASPGAPIRVLRSLTPRQIRLILVALAVSVTWYLISDYFDFNPAWLFLLGILLSPALVALYLVQTPVLDRARPVIRLGFMTLMFLSSVVATLLFVSSPGEEIVLFFLAGRLGEVLLFLFLLRDLLPSAAIPRHG